MSGTGARPDGYDDLRRALQADAERAARADRRELWTGVGKAVHRRRRRRRVGEAVAATTLSAVVIAVGLQVVPLGTGDSDRLTSDGRSASPTSRQSIGPSPGGSLPSGEMTPPNATARTPLAERTVTVTPDAARAAVREAGYGQDDLRQLAQVWRWLDVQDVEVVAGARLLRDESLPLRPGQPAGESSDRDGELYQNLLAYAGAGYDDGDAATLAQRWGETPALVRMLVGELVRTGALPPATD